MRGEQDTTGKEIYIMKKYGLGSFLFDCFMVCITGGLWLFWILFRFLRTK
jgi:hypothetical protein